MSTESSHPTTVRRIEGPAARTLSDLVALPLTDLIGPEPDQ